MPRPRLEQNRQLPKRWSMRHGAFYYGVPPGDEPKWDGKKLFLLGRTKEEADLTWQQRTGALSCVVDPRCRREVLQRLSAKWGLDEETHESMMRRQQGRCPLCNRAFIDLVAPRGWSRTFEVDHCHKTGVVRGYLCRDCNLAEGMLARSGVDPVAWAERLAVYHTQSLPG